MKLSDLASSPETDGGFVAFFTGHYQEVSKALFLLTGDPGEAEELAQEAMARVCERWDRVRSMESPGGYLHRTGARRRGRTAALRFTDSHPGADPAQVVEDRSEVLRLLGSLSVPQRQVVVLVEWLGLDSVEAASLLGIKAASVRTRLHRARTALHAAIGED
jgi:RNA polymerase sigma factor (sigma-70 family)